MKNAWILPARIASQASTVFSPFSRGGSNPYCWASRSIGISSGFSEMPTVRWPCTLLWPRTGQMPAPGLPMLPRMSCRFTSIRTVSTPLRCWVSPMP